MQKGFAPILILVGIVAIIGITSGAYYFGKSQTPKSQAQNQVVSQTSQPTTSATSPAPTGAGDNPVPNDTGETANPDQIGANWKTYIHPLKFFSFKVPRDWIVDKNGGNPIQLSNVNLVNPPATYKGKILAITIYIDTISMLLQDYVAAEKRESIELHGAEAVGSWEESTIRLDGQLAIQVKQGGLFPGTDIFVQDPSKSAIVSLSFIGDYDNYPNLINQILSTFRFDSLP